MRLLAVYSTDRILGGGEISFTLTLKAAQSNGWQVLAAVPAAGQLSAYLTRNNISFIELPQETLRGFRIARLIHPDPAWLKLVDEYRPDLIHCNAIRPALYAQAVGRRCAVPVILHARKETRDPTDPFLVSRLAGIVCISNVVRDRFPQNSRALLRVIYNPIDVEEFRHTPRAAELRQEWCRGAGDFLIGLPGRFSPVKGQLRLIDAASIVASLCANVRFVLIGEEDELYPGYTEEIKKTLKAGGLNERFVFAGFHEDMPSVYAALDAVVFPTSAEAFGRIVIEAGAARKPLVASDIEVIREILPSPSDDFVVNSGNFAQFAAKITRIIKEASYRESLTDRLYDHVQRMFGMKAHWEQIAEMYTDVIAGFVKKSRV